jgi:hypothetical protein
MVFWWFPTAPRLALLRTVLSAPQRYPDGCRNCVIPAQRKISVRNRADGMKRAWAQNHKKSIEVSPRFRYGNEFTVESVAKIQKDALPERIHNPGITGSLKSRKAREGQRTVTVNFRFGDVHDKSVSSMGKGSPDVLGRSAGKKTFEAGGTLSSAFVPSAPP